MTHHKWSGLFETFRAGGDVEPRCATEVHGDDLADAVVRVLHMDESGFYVFNVSDFLLDRRDLLALISDRAGTETNLPERAISIPGVMDTSRLRRLGWKPGGLERLKAFINACRAF